jgi:5-methyltetrahydrofolate--homocysteine methyltransferase
MNETSKTNFANEINAEYQSIRDKQTSKKNLLPIDEARKMKPNLF